MPFLPGLGLPGTASVWPQEEDESLGTVNVYSNSTLHFFRKRLELQRLILQSIAWEPGAQPRNPRVRRPGRDPSRGWAGRSDCDLPGPSLASTVMLKGSCWPPPAWCHNSGGGCIWSSWSGQAQPGASGLRERPRW